ncbi:hypothetical protein R69608_07538 [Paraburkholderia nemoris]|uniref:hypothetical protein n=1 Tax=Paraburkholderia nemoris TaxID=2793076 RepID=UPI001B23A70D|nr:hypothetical protein [Paraburkholderia nemoris]CAE6971290.1 hypothetical protein R69608_07538 [Paraburkholderia nemoris]
MLDEKGSTVARLIKDSSANGPIADAFPRIQATVGNAAAYDYLRAEADRFHATPHGYCLNSLTVDHCPKHLECYADCRHLSATDLPENRQNLIQLEGTFKLVLETTKAKPINQHWMEEPVRPPGDAAGLLTGAPWCFAVSYPNFDTIACVRPLLWPPRRARPSNVCFDNKSWQHAAVHPECHEH